MGCQRLVVTQSGCTYSIAFILNIMSSKFSFFADSSPIFNSSNIVATKSLSSPFGYNDCDTSQYIHYSQSTHQQPSSSSNVLGVNMAIERDSSVSEAHSNSDGIFNRLNQYPLPMPPLPPNVQLPYQTVAVAPTTIGEIERYQLQ